MSKICKICNINKTFENYHKDKTTKDGYYSRCKECVKKRERKKNFTTESHIICKTCNILKPLKSFYKNSTCINGYSPNCKECKNYKNSTYLEKQRLNERNRYKNDDIFRIKKNLRNRFRKLVKNKFTSSINLLGCNFDYFTKWIEFQFEDWMTWKNYGEWEYDHVIPCNSFNLKNISDQEKCFNWRNFQPLRKIDNIIKKDKIIDYTTHLNKIKYFEENFKYTSKEEEGSTTR